MKIRENFIIWLNLCSRKMLFKIIFLTLLLDGLNYTVCDGTTTTTTTTSTTTTLSPDNITCPLDFVRFDTKCYTFSESCPYNLSLPFRRYQNILNETNETCILDINKDHTYDYYQWTEPLGYSGKLFNENFTENDTGGDYVIADFATPDVTYSTVDNASEFKYMCAYDMSGTNSGYCGMYDKICENGTNRRNTTNCHCQNVTQPHYFCQLKCDNYTDYNETICDDCEEILLEYKEPKITLSFDYHRKVTYVSVTSYLKLVPLNEYENVSVYCYTDANISKSDVTYRYEGKEIVGYNTTNYKNRHYTIAPMEKLIGHYWCEGFEIGDTEITKITSNSIVADKDSDDSFTMNITVEEDKRTYPLTLHETTRDCIKTTFINVSLLISDVRFLKLYEKNETTNLTTIGYRIYFNGTNMVDVLSNTSQLFQNYTVDVGPSYCLRNVTNINNMNLTWKKTQLGMTVIPEELCLQNDSTPVTRKCVGEYLYGVYWSEVQGSCINNSGVVFGSKSTTSLHNLTKNNNMEEKIEELQNILDEKRQHIMVDAHFMAQIFENITLSDAPIDLKKSIRLVSDIMELNRTVLRGAQLLLNSTDMLLYNLDMILSNYNYTDLSESFNHVTKNVFVQVSAFSTTNITGTAIYETDNRITMKPLHSNYNLDNLPTENLKLVAFITGTQLSQVTNLSKEARLVITAFRHDSLFNDGSYPPTTGYQVGVFVTTFEQPFLYDYVRLNITPDRKYRANLYCNHWNYGRDKLWYNQHGKWNNDFKATPFKDTYSCNQWAMTKIAIITGAEADVVLSVVAAVGCALSMFGSTAVIITGLVYKNWRENSGTKVLLNFVLTNFSQNIIVAASSGVDSYKQKELCLIIGACLHYSVISQFTWMVIIGYLQYERYVRVFYTVSTRFVLVSSIAAWVVPTVPVITVLAIDEFDESAYVQENYCYLHDKKLLLYGVYLPVAITLISNTFIFFIILFNIYCQKSNSISVRDNISWLNLRLVILLFFLLGLYWVFGVAARLTQLIAFDYFFCISAAVQGIVIFLYFIVFNKMTRNFWLKQLRRSEMITAMQIWLQQRRKIGRVKIDKGRVKEVKVGMFKTLKVKREGVKLA